VKAATEKLERASHKAAEELYKTAAPGGEGGPPPGAGPGPEAPGGEEKKKDNVVDAEFKQV
jgi:molecular chaperone DnaK